MKSKLIKPNVIFTLTAVLLILFSGGLLLWINRINGVLYNNCELREYVDWVKEVETPLSPQRISTLEIERRDLLRIKSGQFFIEVLAGRLQKIENFLQRGYETVRVPDEERRAQSRQEVEDYKNCLKDQVRAKKEQPEVYKLLYIGDGIILVAGMLIALALKSRRDL